MDKIVVGPVGGGLRTDRLPFNIDNDNFPVLTNAYQWRGRVKRKRGTAALSRLQRFFSSTISSYSSISSIMLSGGAGNLITGFSLETNASIVPGTVIIIDTTASNTYTDSNMDGTLQGTPSGSGTINYASGAITISGGNSDSLTASFFYYPDLPVLGLEDLTIQQGVFPGTIEFDTKYAYNQVTAQPYPSYNITFYKNPIADSLTMPGYIPKTTPTGFNWNGNSYQQFWSTNYQGALWVTNGIDVPFTGSNLSMQYKFITGIVENSFPTIVDITIMSHGLVVGDFLFINEVTGITGINFQTGYVIAFVDFNTVTVEFPFATIGGKYSGGGIAQYLTNTAVPGKDCLRWYDGDPTNGSLIAPGFSQGFGWVNFCPPLSFNIYSVANTPEQPYYLIGARMIFPFKDRLIFVGPVIQNSGDGIKPIYLQDTVIYSQNGTAFYTASFTGDPTLFSTLFYPLLVPVNQTATPGAYFSDQTGFGGYISAGVDEPINTGAPNEDVLILGFNTLQSRFVYTGDDIIPFSFYLIDAELSSGSTFSVINMGHSVLTRGDRGFVTTHQRESKRFDMDILDNEFQDVNLLLNGAERFTAVRDYINEWLYFTYRQQQNTWTYPTQTLLYNYRDESWAIFNESYTHYGQFRKTSGYTWQTIGLEYETWEDWNDPWNSGVTDILEPNVIAGNQQGFVVIKGVGTGEAPSLYIQNIVGSAVTSPDHCLTNGDYITIQGAIGTVGAEVNGFVFSVEDASQNSFTLNPTIDTGLTYLGLGTITRFYVPFIQTKQFPVAWAMGRKVRLGVQQYLLTKTNNAQIQLLIFLSQDAATQFNNSPIVPDPLSINNSLIYSTVLYTCPESTNLGLTPANSNLQMLVNPTTGASGSAQIWHRKNTSLIGDTVQLGFTMSDTQMRDPTMTNQTAEIELHGFILSVAASQLLA